MSLGFGNPDKSLDRFAKCCRSPLGIFWGILEIVKSYKKKVTKFLCFYLKIQVLPKSQMRVLYFLGEITNESWL